MCSQLGAGAFVQRVGGVDDGCVLALDSGDTGAGFFCLVVQIEDRVECQVGVFLRGLDGGCRCGFLRHVSPKIYQPLKERLRGELEKIRRNNYGSIFHIMKTEVKGGRAVITGLHNGVIGKTLIPARMRTFSMEFSYSGGNLLIESFHEVRMKNGRAEKVPADGPGPLPDTLRSDKRDPGNSETHVEEKRATD